MTEANTTPVVPTTTSTTTTVEATTAAPVTTTPASEITVTTPVTESILSEALTKSEAPPVEATPASVEGTTTETPVETKTEVTQTTEGQSVEPAPPPVYDTFTLPEGVQLEEPQVKEFTDMLGEFETTSKAEHKLVQEFGQKAVDFYIKEVNRVVTGMQDFYQKAFDKQKTDWKDAFLADPEIGGNKMQTTVDAALNFIRQYGGTQEQQTELKQVMNDYGVGNHKALIRLFANAGFALAEGKPLAASAPVVAQPKSKVATLYGRNQ